MKINSLFWLRQRGSRERISLKGQITDYSPASQITSISTKSDSKTLLLQFGIIVRVLGAHFLALKNDPCTANNPAVNIEHTPRKFLHLTITITKDIHTKTWTFYVNFWYVLNK